jgi:hypothetical protein
VEWIYQFFSHYGWFNGYISKYDAATRLYSVLYEDDDCEKMDEKAVAKLVAWQKKRDQLAVDFDGDGKLECTMQKDRKLRAYVEPKFPVGTQVKKVRTMH